MSPRICIAAVLVLAAASILRAQAPDPVKESLSRPVLAPGEALEDVQRFCETRVAPMPQVTTASEWRAFASRNRADTLKKVVLRGEALSWSGDVTNVEWQGTIEGGPGYRIRKLRYQVLPGLWVPALLYEPEKLEGNVPVVLNVNGHDADGKAADYKQIRCINLAKRGMLALNTEWFGMGQLRTPGNQHGLINAIDLCGTSGIATHYLALKRGLDVLLSRPNADATRVAVTGLSGGGWQTIFISGLDPRVTLSNPVAGYSSFRTRVRHQSDLGDSEQTPSDLASVTDYAQLTAMIAPRPALLTFNAKDDCCFRADHALQPLLDAAGPVYKLFPNTSTALQSHVNENPGTHNYLQDNREALYRMLGQHFYPGGPFDAKEIPSGSEVKTKDQLHVELPSANADFASIALRLSRDLPRTPKLPTDRYYASLWRTSQASKLRKIIKTPEYELVPHQAGTELAGDIQVTRWKLRLGGTWSVPAVEMARGNPQETVLVVADGGRASAADIVNGHLSAGKRVVAVDPFFLGESLQQPAGRAYLWPLLVGSVGSRPVGIQASQLRAVSRWLREERKTPVTLSASGPRSTLAALIATGLEERAIVGLELRGALGSLKEPIEQKMVYQTAPELFCFGLLEAFDIKQLAALSAPRPVRFLAPSERARTELAGLGAWYKTLGKDFDPLK